MSWLRTLWKVSSRAKNLVGSDLAGNQYFEQLVEGGKPKECFCVQIFVNDMHVCSSCNKLMGISASSFYIGRPKRSVKMKEISSAYEYTPESVPPEWDRTFIKITVV